jgi:hypothetical protein
MGNLSNFDHPVKGDFMRKFDERQSTVPLDLIAYREFYQSCPNVQTPISQILEKIFV